MINSNFFFISILLFLGALSGGGADTLQYWEWTKYFQNFEINSFNNLGKSTNGLPLSSWYYGSGIIPALINKILLIEGEIAKKINSLLLTFINLFLLRNILIEKKIYGLNNLALICLFLIFFPGGYYVNKLSSEAWTVFFTLASLYFIEKKTKKNLIFYSFNIGICIYFLLLIKPNNIFLCVSLILIFYIKKMNNFNLKNLFSKKFLNIQILTFFLILGICLILIYQKILLGNYFESFYSFGDENVKSFNLKNFKAFEVLFSSWHGLIFYHPLYLILNFYLFFLLFKKDIDSNLKKLITINLLVFLLQILIQSSWAFWWMGTGTYGARAFAGTSVITLYSLISIQKIKILPNKLFLMLFIILLTWNSFLIYFGETNFISYESFFEKIFRNHSIILIIKLLLISVFLYIIIKIYNKNNLIFLNYILISTSIFLFLSNIYSAYNLKKIIYLIIAVFFLYLFYFFFNIKNYFFKKKFLSIPFLIILFFSLNAQFQLLNDFNNHKTENYKTGVNFNCMELKGTLEEYDKYKKFDEEKAHWKKFYVKNCMIK